MVRRNGRLAPATWGEAFAAVTQRLKSTPADRIGVIAGDLQDVEAMKAAKDLFGGMGVASLDCRQDGLALGAGPRESWLFNTTIEGLERADVILLVGANPRLEAAVLNARIRKLWMAGKTRVGVIGEAVDLTYRYDHLGAGPDALASLLSGDSDFAKALKGAKAPAIIIGQGALTRPDSGLERLERAAHRRGPGRGPRSGIHPGGGRQDGGTDGGQGRRGCARPAGRRRDRS
jgi:NADH-quinone oxidoreductase subunit G